jgi:hypothetical protein
MTIETGDSGFTGFGYGNNGSAGQDNSPPQSSEPRHGNGAGDHHGASAGGSASAQSHAEAEEVSGDLGYDQVPGFETSASNCVNRARRIANSLNHATFSSDHLMLALTMDQNARRLLERVGDVTQLRAHAMRRLGKNYNKSDSTDQSPTPTSDLADIGKKAREAANEREQLVSISDLIGAFPKENGRLSYGAGENSRSLTVLDTLEKRLIPGISDAVARIEHAVSDNIQRQHQTVQSILADLSHGQARDWERRQSEFMDAVRAQIREVADVQIAAAIKDLTDKIDAKVAAIPTNVPPIETPKDEKIAPPETPGRTPRSTTWPWSIIL